jgi:hypothetical protein
MEVEEVEQAEADLPFSCKIRGFTTLSKVLFREPSELGGFHRLWEEHDNESRPALRSVWDLRGVEGFEPEDKPWEFALPPSMELDGQGNLLSEEHDSGPTSSPRYFSMSDK